MNASTNAALSGIASLGSSLTAVNSTVNTATGALTTLASQVNMTCSHVEHGKADQPDLAAMLCRK